MIDKQAFKKMIDYLEGEDEKRENIIAMSREVIKCSKRVIYSIHRANKEEYESLTKELEKKFSETQQFIKKCEDVNSQGSYAVAEQEYVEAMLYYDFVGEKTLRTAKQLNVSVENYLMGVCDLSGELSRKATMACIEKDFKMVLKIKKLLEEIFGYFLLTNLRNSELRKKSDQIKWNLKSVEDVVYDLTMKGLI